MTPHDYVTDIVLPTVRELLADRGDRRRAFLACVATYHVIDHLAFAMAKQGVSNTADRKGRDKEAEIIRGAVRAVCTPSLAVVHGICNGTKHADLVAMRDVPQFAFDTPGAGFDQGRWGTKGLEVEHDGRKLFVDWCVQAVLLTLRANYGARLDPMDLTFFDAAFRGQPGWSEPA